MFEVVGHILVKNLLLINYFFDATHKNSRIFWGTVKSSLINDCFFFPSTTKY